LRFSQFLAEATTATKPTDGTFDNPTFEQNDEAFDLIATADDFGDQAQHGVRQTVVEHRPCTRPGTPPFSSRHHPGSTIAQTAIRSGLNNERIRL
jgi:hypothetical protein